MENRMKNHPLGPEELEALLIRESTGTLSTIGADGYPYGTPVHYVYHKGRLYIHGLPKGQKITNLKNNDKVCFSVFEEKGLLLDKDEKPCDTNTIFESVIITGQATILGDLSLKRTVLEKIVEKYTPHIMVRQLPEAMVKGTGVIEIVPEDITGKFYE